jgi:NAD-dependent dihydropyrimidine dehydrogenase PreA subunit
VSFCPTKSLAQSKELNKLGIKPAQIKPDESCNACGMCVLICPDACIQVVKKPVGVPGGQAINLLRKKAES